VGCKIDANLDRLEAKKAKKDVYRNISYLSILRMVNYGLPLVTLPYLVLTLGAEMFGLISFAQAVIQYCNIIVDFGFNLSATRDISIHRENQAKVAEIVSSVLTMKLVLMIGVFLVWCGMIFLIPKFKAYWMIYLVTYGLVVGDGLFPLWFFQGLEKMQYLTVLNAAAKIIFTVLIFLVVKDKADYLLVPLVNSFGQVIIDIIALYIVFKKFQVRVIIPQYTILKHYTLDSFQLFLSRVWLSLYTVANTVILGFATSNELTGYYAVAEKLIRALEGLVQPLIDALYPYMARSQNKMFIKNIIQRLTIVNVVFISMVFCCSDYICIILFGKLFLASAVIFKIYLVEVVITIPSALFGLPFLVAFGYYKWFNASNCLGFIGYILGVLIISIDFTAEKLVIIAVLAQSIVLVHRIYGIYKFDLWPKKRDINCEKFYRKTNNKFLWLYSKYND